MMYFAMLAGVTAIICAVTGHLFLAFCALCCAGTLIAECYENG
jgi:hypothetical protein